MSKQSTETKKKVRNGSFRSIFMHADGADMFLMTLGFLGAVGDGISMPTMLLITSKIMNNIGDSSSSSMTAFTDKINQVNIINYKHVHIYNTIKQIKFIRIKLQKSNPASTFRLQNAVNLCYMAIGIWVSCFLGRFQSFR